MSLLRRLFGLGPRSPIDAKALAATIRPGEPMASPARAYVGPRRRAPLDELAARRDRLKAVLRQLPAKVDRLLRVGQGGEAAAMQAQEAKLRARLLSLEFEIDCAIARAKRQHEPRFDAWRAARMERERRG